MFKKVLMLTPGQGTVGAITSIKKIYNKINKTHYEIVIGVDGKGENLNKLREENYRIQVLDLNFGNNLLLFLSKISLIRSLKSLFISFFKDIKKINSFLQKEKIDIFHTHYLHHHILSIFVTRKVKKVWHLRSFINPQSLGGFSFIIFNILILFTKAKIIAISKSLKNSFWKINQNKIEVVYNGIDPEALLRMDLEVFYKRIGDKSYSKIIGTIGRYNKLKGFHDFIEMANIISKDHDNIIFVIVGPTNDPREETYLKLIKQKIKDYNLNSKIFLMGSFESANKFMGAINILVHPNTIFEGFGNVVAEAQTLGIPVITTDCGGPLDIVRDGHSGFIVNKNAPEELADKLNDLISNTSLYELMSKNAQDSTFINQFRIEKTIEALEKIYSN
jgi:glycosyltransferase involved in cell wall biosynthesis